MLELYLILIMSIILIVLLVCSLMPDKKEVFDILEDMVTKVGGSISYKMKLDGYSTVVRKLLGNNGKTVILLHNSPFDSQIWNPLYMYYQSLVKNDIKIPTLITYDLLGHGTAWVPIDEKYNNSDMFSKVWDIKDFSESVITLYNKYIKKGKVIVASYGFGVSVAVRFALDHKDLVESLYIFNNIIKPVISGIQEEINYLVNWIEKSNKKITYLTLQENFVQHNLCIWFQNKIKCPYPLNAKDEINTFDTVEYIIGEKMMRAASATTYLQADKISVTIDFSKELVNANLDFPIVQVISNMDVYTPVYDSKQEYIKYIKKASKDTKLYITKGKHGFTLIHPEYIGKLIMGEDLTNDPATIETVV